MKTNYSKEVEIICFKCGEKALKKVSAVNRAKRENRNIFCSKECFRENRKIYYDEIESKICTVCNKEKELSSFRKRIKYNKDYYVSMCTVCEKKRSYSQRNLNKRREYEKKRFSIKTHRDKKNRYQVYWRSKNIHKNRIYHKIHIKKQVDNISDVYVKRLFRIPYTYKHIKGITPEMIESKRTIIKIKRFINN